MPHHGDKRVDIASVIHSAHDAAISAMIYAKDADNSWYDFKSSYFRIITGSFDRTVKVWSLDGNLLQRFEFLYVILFLRLKIAIKSLNIETLLRRSSTLYQRKLYG